MTVIAIDSLKNLPANAEYGNSLIFFYLLACITFFIPTGLIAAELASAWPETGGIYIWVREAFGKKIAFLTAWLQWLYMIIWYPTILSFLAVTLAYLIGPTLGSNNMYVLTVILIIFWLTTAILCMGIEVSSIIASLTAIFGVIIPMIFITILGTIWIVNGNPLQIHLTFKDFTINLFTENNLRLYITLLFSVMGMEMIAIHAGDANNPTKSYPRALILAGILILATVIPASLAIAIVVPPSKIQLTSGVIEGFVLFLSKLHLEALKIPVIIAIIIGCFGIFMTWLLAAARCLLVAAYDKSLPTFMAKTNKKNMPVNLLLIQGVIFSLLCYAFIALPSVNTAFWFLTVASAQLALIYYLFFFTAAIRLRYKKPEIIRPFRLGQGNITMWTICLIGSLSCLTAIAFGFLPPAEMTGARLFGYEFSLVLLIAISCATAFIIYRTSHKNNL
jgi:amino acid transporter